MTTLSTLFSAWQASPSPLAQTILALPIALTVILAIYYLLKGVRK